MPPIDDLTTPMHRRRCLGWLGAMLAPAAVHAANPGDAGSPAPGAVNWPGGTAAPMLARVAPPDVDPAGWLVSEKYDGVRALWDGRTLRFRSGRVVAAPAWFLATLPPRALDGELWLGRGRFEALSARVRRASPRDEDWRPVRYMVFDLQDEPGPYARRAERLQALLQPTPAGAAAATRMAVPQERLADAEALSRRLAEVVAGGGEGLMLHHEAAIRTPGRSERLLKLKPLHDAEATVVGHVAGRGRHAGRLGALRVRSDDVAGGAEFLIGTGFSDAQRQAPPARGSTVTYTHRGMTSGGLPRFASFLRAHDAGW